MNETCYPLDDLTIAVIADLQRQLIAAEGRIQGALTLFLRQHDLQGQWGLAPNGREVQRIDAPATASNQLKETINGHSA